MYLNSQPIVLRLRSKAFNAYAQHTNRGIGEADLQILYGVSSATEFTEELASLSGDTRIFSMGVLSTLANSATSAIDGHTYNKHGATGGKHTTPSDTTDATVGTPSGLDSMFFHPGSYLPPQTASQATGIDSTSTMSNAAVGPGLVSPFDFTGVMVPDPGVTLTCEWDPPPSIHKPQNSQAADIKANVWQDAWDSLMNESGVFLDDQSNNNTADSWSSLYSI